MINSVSTCHCGDHAWRPIKWAVVLCDPAYAQILDGTWNLRSGPNTAYAARNENIHEDGKKHTFTVWFHHIVRPTPRSLVVDHINGNGLDNRKSNLRVTTMSVNSQNTRRQKRPPSGYRGVSIRGKKFFAHICKHNKQINLGFFSSAEEAARAYDAAAIELFGPLAPVNFPRKAA